MNRPLSLCCVLVGLGAACSSAPLPGTPRESTRAEEAGAAGRSTRLGPPVRVEIDPARLTRIPFTGRRVAAGPVHVRDLATAPIEPAVSGFRLKDADWSIRTPGEEGVALPRVVDLSAGPIPGPPRPGAQPPIVIPLTEPAPRPIEPFRQKEGATHDIRTLDVVQGLPAAAVYAMHMDARGYLWMGTNGAGLVRYDGVSALSYKEEQGLGDNRVWAIAPDARGRLWLGTDHGVERFDGDSFLHYDSRQGLPSDKVNALLVDRGGDAWVGTDLGLSRISGNRVVTYTAASGLPDDMILGLTEDKKGGIWIGTGHGGASRFDGHRFRTLPGRPLGADRVNALLEDDEGGVWLATEGGGVSRLDGESITRYAPPPAAGSDRVRALLQSRDGTIWIGTDGGGVLAFDGRGFRVFDKESGLSDDHIRSLLEDGHGILWIGTYVNGVNRYDPASFATLRSRAGLAGDRVSALMTDSSGQLWFGIFGGGAQRFDGRRFYGFDKSNGLIDDIVHVIYQDRKGHLWFGTRGGACRYDGKAFTYFSAKDGLAGNIVHTIIEDSEGAIWFGTREGITRFDGRELVSFTHKLGLPNDWVYTIREDASKRLWFGTNGGGVLRYDGKGFDVFGPAQGLSSDRVYAIHKGASGDLWLGTRNGVDVIEPDASSGDRIQAITTEDGLSNPIVLSLIEDTNGSVWAGTEGGINLLEPAGEGSSRPRQFRIQRFLHADGLGAIDVSLNTVAITPGREIWWGGGAGSVHRRLDGDSSSKRTPTLRINGLDLMGRFIDFRALARNGPESGVEFGSVPSFENLPAGLRLSASLNHLTFRFAAVDWLAPQGIEYQYRLDPLDGNWSPPTRETAAEYRNTDYGALTFRVRARVSNGPWTAPSSYSLVILPPWWRTWWASTVFLLAGLGLVGAGYRLRLRALLRRQRELEGMVVERTAEVARQRDELARLNQSLLEKNEAIFRKAVTDELTGLYNRSLLLEVLAKEFANARRYDSELSLIAVDIDHFKSINDTYGHPVGDEALRHVAQILVREIRAGDYVFRQGGEEFLILLPSSPASQALQVAEKVRREIESSRFTALDQRVVLTASFGVSDIRGVALESEDQLISRADQALYRAKREGRNLVRLFAAEPTDRGREPD